MCEGVKGNHKRNELMMNASLLGDFLTSTRKKRSDVVVSFKRSRSTRVISGRFRFAKIWREVLVSPKFLHTPGERERAGDINIRTFVCNLDPREHSRQHFSTSK